MKLHTKLGIDNGSKVTRPDFPKKIWFLDKRGKSVEKWQKIRFFGFLSKTSHGIFLKFGKKLQFNSRNNVTVLDFLKKIWVLDKRGIVFFFKIFCDIFSTGVHSIHLVTLKIIAQLKNICFNRQLMV